MSKMHNLGTVFKFETLRTLKKPTFWFDGIGFSSVDWRAVWHYVLVAKYDY